MESKFIFEVDPGAAERRNEADRACHQLCIDLRMSAPELVIEIRQPDGIAETRDLPAILTTVVASGVKLGVFAAMFRVVKAWLDSRPKAEVTITYPNGSVLKVSNATLDQAIEILKEQGPQV
jgi:Effector Associated Constant Component 1